MIALILILFMWIIPGIIAHGLIFSYFQDKYPGLAEEQYSSDLRFALLIGICGLGGLLGAIFSGLIPLEDSKTWKRWRVA